MDWYIIVVTFATIYVVYTICKLFGVFERHSGSIKAAEKQEEEITSKRKRAMENFKLGFYETMTGFTSFMFPPKMRAEHDYFIRRLDIRSEVLNRYYTPEEYRGRNVTILAIGLLCIPLFFVKKFLIVISIGCIIYFCMYQTFKRNDIQEEDDIIDANFTDLYLLLYSELRKGSKGSIKKVVLSYQQSLKGLGNSQVGCVMSKFTESLLNSLSYTTEAEAIEEIKLKYKSALITNFCNVAKQSLQGIDNYDTLLSTKINLVEKRKQRMIAITEKRRKIGEALIFGVYFILFQFVLLSILSKFPNVSSMF